MKTCNDCIHEYACKCWTAGRVLAAENASRCPAFETAKDSAAYLIGKLDAAPKWISVKERLPEEKLAVLAYGQRFVFNGKRIEGFPMEHVAYTRGVGEGWFSWDSEDVIKVTHWMPTPSVEGLNDT